MARKMKKKLGNMHFLLFPQCFFIFPKTNLHWIMFFCCLQIIWTSLQFCHPVNWWNGCSTKSDVRSLHCLILEVCNVSNYKKLSSSRFRALTLSQTSPGFLRVCSTSVLKTLGKGEIARNEQFLLFPQCFLPVWITFCHLYQIWNCRLLTLSIWKSLKFVVWERVKDDNLTLYLSKKKKLDHSKLKAFADDKMHETQKLKFVMGWVRNIVGEKRERAGYQYFLLLSWNFQNSPFSGSLKVGIEW